MDRGLISNSAASSDTEKNSLLSMGFTDPLKVAVYVNVNYPWRHDPRQWICAEAREKSMWSRRFRIGTALQFTFGRPKTRPSAPLTGMMSRRLELRTEHGRPKHTAATWRQVRFRGAFGQLFALTENRSACYT
jgi:hypothetical protein